MSASAPELDAMIGRTLGGKYRLVRVIGRGGMGAVFEAENVAIAKRFAVKMLDPEWAKDPGVAGRFAREARAASAVDSEHIVSVVDAGSDDGCPYIAMELLRGEDLGTRLRRETRVAQRDALHITAQVLRGLVAAHDAGIVHRDLKPDNVLLVDRAGDANFVKIVDFGVSKVRRPDGDTTPLALTHRGVILGTPLYMAPEQARSLPDVDGRADLYSVGAILFECLTGRPPHVGESYEQILLSVCMQDAPDVRATAPGVPADVSAFVARALARERSERFSSAAEMLAALRVITPMDPAVRPLSTEGGLATPPTSGGPQTEAAWTTPEIEAQLRARRARARAVATAVVATFSGAAATIAVLAMRPAQKADLSGPPGAGVTAGASIRSTGEPSAPAPPAPGSALAASASPSSPPRIPPQSSPSRNVAPSGAATNPAPRPLASLPLLGGGAAPPRPSASRVPPASSTGLDIQRELP
jgi:serine/threonine-protein kinase